MTMDTNQVQTRLLLAFLAVLLTALAACDPPVVLAFENKLSVSVSLRQQLIRADADVTVIELGQVEPGESAVFKLGRFLRGDPLIRFEARGPSGVTVWARTLSLKEYRSLHEAERLCICP